MIDIEPICECECSEEGSEGYDFTSEHCDYHGEEMISFYYCGSILSSQETLSAENASVLTDLILVTLTLQNAKYLFDLFRRQILW